MQFNMIISAFYQHLLKLWSLLIILECQKCAQYESQIKTVENKCFSQ